MRELRSTQLRFDCLHLTAIWFSVVLGVAVVRCGGATAAASPAATQPADNAERGTDDALAGIDAIGIPTPLTRPSASSTPPSPSHSGGHSSADAGDEISSSAAELDESARPNSLAAWAQMARLFAPMLVLAAAVGVSGSVIGLFVLLRRECY